MANLARGERLTDAISKLNSHQQQVRNALLASEARVEAARAVYMNLQEQHEHSRVRWTSRLENLRQEQQEMDSFFSASLADRDLEKMDQLLQRIENRSTSVSDEENSHEAEEARSTPALSPSSPRIAGGSSKGLSIAGQPAEKPALPKEQNSDETNLPTMSEETQNLLEDDDEEEYVPPSNPSRRISTKSRSRQLAQPARDELTINGIPAAEFGPFDKDSDGHWVELACRICGANKNFNNLGRTAFFKGTRGLLGHMRSMHRDELQGPESRESVLRDCRVRFWTEQEVEALGEGSENAPRIAKASRNEAPKRKVAQMLLQQPVRIDGEDDDEENYSNKRPTLVDYSDED
ncbi:hypothetical protein HII31_11187 [Pseudocercospora fuligena]|uniref:Uncharacterized protein n=1 Tax=Pseudocercospora fuligena TaxID=685502 RepID=A0A8H6RBM1_9PEZI|nr:hypothetical protein HII31_11187 [Pseudocercospora fuligena]